MLLHLFFRLVLVRLTSTMLTVGVAVVTLPYPECPVTKQQTRCTDYAGVATIYLDTFGISHVLWSYPHPNQWTDTGPHDGTLPVPTCSRCVIDPEGSQFPAMVDGLSIVPSDLYVLVGSWAVINGAWMPDPTSPTGVVLTNR